MKILNVKTALPKHIQNLFRQLTDSQNFGLITEKGDLTRLRDTTENRSLREIFEKACKLGPQDFQTLRDLLLGFVHKQMESNTSVAKNTLAYYKIIEEMRDNVPDRSSTDALTGLPNRAAFDKALNEAKNCEKRAALLFIDLDGFKQINDGHNHTIGDRVLQIAAKRMAHAIRKGDSLFRLGGDEFTIILKNITNEECIEKVKTDLEAAFDEPITLEGDGQKLKLEVGLSIGGTLIDGRPNQNIVEEADQRMYEHKAVKKAHWRPKHPPQEVSVEGGTADFTAPPSTPSPRFV